jgi:arginase
VLYQLSYLAAATQCTEALPGLSAPLTLGVAAVGASVRAVNRGTSREIAIIGAALDLGQGRRGVDMGPSAIRYAGLEERLQSLGYEVRDEGNVETAVAEATALRDERARFLPEVHDTCELVASRVAEATKRGALPLVLGGDHSVALGTLGGLASVHGPGGVLWIDAHSDINTPQTSPTGNVHGMALAAALGLAGEGFESEHWPLPSIDARRVALIGIRELDDGERRLLRETGVRVFTMSEIDRIGIERAVRESLDRILGAGFVHVSLDMDALDPDIAPGVGTPVQGGLTYREAHLALELVAESGLAGSLEVVEVNPILDRENTTALTAVELIASALGKTIY